MTRARRASRDARAESADFRKRTEELSSQAKSGKLRGVRRGQVAPTDALAQAEAVKFRADNGLPVADTPTAEQLMARLPNQDAGQGRPARVAENDDFSEHQVLFDVDKEAREARPSGPVGNDSPEPEAARSSESEGDFSQPRIPLDDDAESYRPDEILQSVFDIDDRQNRR
ncbi:hypothetical protein [Actinophytocola sp.]|uniref:hypothetical protein n=1 Tax=Actinophytocola sp. TaxID=1872138 RepID=UPI002ED0035F